MTTEFILVPVPRERVQEVYRLLAQEPAPAGVVGAQETPAAQPGSWTEADIVTAYRESPEKMKLFLDYLASSPGQSFTSAETANAVGYTRQQQAGMLGAFGHRAKRRYGRSSWFITYLWSGERSAFVYSMDLHAAKVIRDLKS